MTTIPKCKVCTHPFHRGVCGQEALELKDRFRLKAWKGYPCQCLGRELPKFQVRGASSQEYAKALTRELFTPIHSDQCPILPDGYWTTKICSVERVVEEVVLPELDDGRDWGVWMADERLALDSE